MIWELANGGRVAPGWEGPSPVHHRAPVEGHEEDLAAAARPHGRKEHLGGDHNTLLLLSKVNPFR